LVKPRDNDAILDVGVTNSDVSYENYLEALYPNSSRIVASGIDHLKDFTRSHPQILAVRADGCYLPFADRSFDVVFSNAVLEHVGDSRRQRIFIQEVSRVGKRVFLTTPNRWFPLDTHTMIPFAHYFPFAWRNRIYRVFGRKYWASIETLNLLSRRKLRGILPQDSGLKIVPQRLLGLVVSYLLVRDSGHPHSARLDPGREKQTIKYRDYHAQDEK